MKRIVILSLIGGGVTAGIIYFIKHFHKKIDQNIQLDFAEYALGGLD